MKPNVLDYHEPSVYFVVGIASYIYRDEFNTIGNINTYIPFISFVVFAFIISLLGVFGITGGDERASK